VAPAGNLSPPQDIPEAQRSEVFCPRSSRWYAFQWSVLRNLQDTPLTLLSAQNLTERMEALRQQRALQEQLLSSSRAMSVGEMTTTLAHEINQPLATIVNCLSAARTMLARGDENPRPLREALDLALEQAEQAGAVVARIREFVRTREPRREVLALGSLIDHVVQLQQVDAQKHRARILVEPMSGLPPVLVDRIMIEQVLTNLIRNAIEAMRTTRPAQRSVTISALQDAECRVVVRVADRGRSVPARDEAQLFTPFFTTKPEGMGIGLAICRSIVEFHGGQLYFERAEGGGSVFAFTLPQADPS
jgi:signal transduction histidine kinase